MEHFPSENSNHDEPGPFEEGYSLSKITAAHDASNKFLSPQSSQSAEDSNDSLISNSKIEPKEHIDMVVFFDKTKAGLQDVDKKKTELIIRKASAGSLYYKNEERKAYLRAQKVNAMLNKKKLYEANIASNPGRMRDLSRQVAELEQELEKERVFDRVFAHIDMDMFYAAVEEKKDPRLREVPFGVGSLQMLSTTNYIARQYGVRSGMPGFIGKKLCPELVVVPLDYTSYKAEAAVVQGIVSHYDADFYAFGLDEQRLDLTNYIKLNFPEADSIGGKYAVAEQVVAECRQKVFEATRLTASAGIGPTPTLAKMASNFNKPNGQHILRLTSREAVMGFMHPLACRQAPGIGKSLEAILQGLGIVTLGDIYDQRYWLYYIFTFKTFYFLLSTALGVGGFMGTANSDSNLDKDANSNPKVDCKSVGNECTFQHLNNPLELKSIAHDILQKVARRLKKKELMCGQVVLKVKHIEFQVKQYSKNLTAYTDDEAVLRRTLDDLLLPVLECFSNYRLLGVRLEKIISSNDYVRLPEVKSQATLDQFFDVGRGKRSRDVISWGDNFVEEEGAPLQRINRSCPSVTRTRDNNCHGGNEKQAAGLPSTSDVILIDSPACSPAVEDETPPQLTVSSSPVVLTYYESILVSPPEEAQSESMKNNNLHGMRGKASNANSEDDVIIVE